MKLDEIVKELNDELDKMEKDENMGKIAAYINESWEQKANFMRYLLDRYSAKATNNQNKIPARKYLYGAAGFTAGFAFFDYTILKTAPIIDAISTFIIGYMSLLTAFEIARSKNVSIINNSLDYAIKNGNLKEDLLDFYKNLKN